MENHKRLTLEDLMTRKLKKDADKMKIKSVYVEELGGNIQLEKIPITRVAGFAENLESDNPTDILRAKIDMIYHCCPILRKPELQTAYECGEPTDIVCKLLDDNLGAINDIVLAIMEMYGLSEGKTLVEEGVETLKN